MSPAQVLLVGSCSMLSLGPCFGDPSKLPDIASLSLEDLGSVHVTSVSKLREPLADAPASIYVISNEAIRRSGARSLPEALRLAPNLQVAQINADQYAISARGFNSSTANKLLVLIDGRTVYTPLYSGVFWDAQDVLLEDIDRIEVISGPGGTLWGANAVNGVINIITKHAAQTSGNLSSAVGGTAQQGLALRHGGALDNHGDSYRVYVKVDNWEHTNLVDGSPNTDAWKRAQAGFRTEWHPSGSDNLTVQGDMYGDQINQVAPGQQHNTGGNLLLRWRRTLVDGSTFRVQSYYDRSTRDTPELFTDTLNTVDVDVQYSLPNVAGTQTILGGGYRVAEDNVGNSATLAVLPAQRVLHWANLFAQQERNLLPNLRLTLGGKLQYNDYSHMDYLPNLKLAWKPVEHTLLWTGLSRAVREPSRIDADFYIPGKAPYLLVGGQNFRSEIANTLDLGWREQIGAGAFFSVTAFHSQYDRLRSVDPAPAGGYVLGNNISGRVDGLEAWTNAQLTQKWSLDAGALLLDEHFSGQDISSSSPGNDPHSQLTLRNHWIVGDNTELDIALRHVAALPAPAVPAYTSVDGRVGWRVAKNLELALSGRNLFNPHHEEYATGGPASSQVLLERVVELAVKVKF